MIAHFKTFAAAVVTMLIGASFLESPEILAEPSDDRIENAVSLDSEADAANIMGDFL